MEWVKNVKVGDKVVCIKDNYFDKNAYVRVGNTLPKVDDILTIRDVTLYGVIPCFRFIEIVNPVQPYFNSKEELKFKFEMFKPLHKGMTDLYDLLRNPDKIVDETNEEKEKFFEIL